MGRWGSGISVDVTVDIDLDDIYSEMSASDYEEMAGWLYKDGHLNKYLERERSKNLTSPVNGGAWEDICGKLADNQLRLTNEEEEIIKKIADRL